MSLLKNLIYILEKDGLIKFSFSAKRVFLALFILLIGLIDILTTKFAISYQDASEDNPLASYSFKNLGLNLTLLFVLLITLFVTSFSFITSEINPVKYLLLFVLLTWVIQKTWVDYSNFLVINHHPSISIFTLFK